MPQLRPIAILTASLALISFALGVWGFSIYQPQLSWANHAYRAIQLFPIDGPNKTSSLPLQLEIARFSAPFSFLLGIIATILHVSRDLFHSALLSFSHGHIVVIGLNQTSSAFVQDALKMKRKVIVISGNSDHPDVHNARTNGAVYLIGNCMDTKLLQRAHIGRASHLFAFTEDDARNVEIITAIAAQLEHSKCSRRNVLRCYVRFQQRNFQQAFKEHSILSRTSDAIDVSLVNMDELAARRCLAATPLEIDESGTVRDQIGLILFGHSSAGLALLHHALRIGHYRTRCKLPVTLVCTDQAQCQRLLDHQFPQITEIADIVILVAADDSPTQLLETFLSSSPSPETWHTLICAQSTDQMNFALCQHLTSHLVKLPHQTLCHISSSPGLATLLHRGKQEQQHTHPLIIPTQLATWDNIVDDTHDATARAIHDAYVAAELAAGKTINDNSSLGPWESLHEASRDQNRLQADHLPIKLRAIGLDPDHLPKKRELDVLLNEHLELLAEMEHRRWNAVQILAGWRHALGKKNPDRLTHPDLIPWEQLSDDTKTKDREPILRISSY